MLKITDSIIKVKGIGPKKASLLNKLAIYTLEDALNYFPRDYAIQRAVIPIDKVRPGQDASIAASFNGKARTRYIKGLSITSISAVDDTGSIDCVWFNQPYRAFNYKADTLYFISGKVNKKNGSMQLQNPLVEDYCKDKHTKDALLPVYRLTKGLRQGDLKNLIDKALECLKLQAPSNFDSYIDGASNLMGKCKAYEAMHYPESEKLLESARQRIAFEEFFHLQLRALYTKHFLSSSTNSLIIKADSAKLGLFFASLDFQLTASQHRAIKDILTDFAGGRPMNRLLQGDVGSGKTLVAATALYAAKLAGLQGAMMAPTELLARQHLGALAKLFNRFQLRIELLVGNMPSSERDKVVQGLAEGKIDILVATHAILQEDIVFKKLGLVISDEQHRFGVRERAVLRSKGKLPHFLAMSATPIPRTLAQIIYGDLDISIMNDMPKGRIAVKTYCVRSSLRERVYRFVRNRVKEGEQAYIVCQLIEESDKIEAISAEELYIELKENYLRDIDLALLHGKLEAKEKELIMDKFIRGQIKVLVATSIVEVGIDAKDATVIVIENAERFGLAQLHQLRGRVGRGHKQSYCILISDTDQELALERLSTIVSTTNGFEIAERDLELRGPGDLYGIKQHGILDLKIADPIKDSKLFALASEHAQLVVSNISKEEYKKVLEESLAKNMTKDIVTS